jgi:hypothetical protein
MVGMLLAAWQRLRSRTVANAAVLRGQFSFPFSWPIAEAERARLFNSCRRRVGRVGSLVGSSGAILSYIMCKAMNRSLFNVILGGFGAEPGAAAAGGTGEQKPVKSGSAEDASFMLGNAETVVIVPGYGLAVAPAQHALKELTDKLVEKGIDVKYATTWTRHDGLRRYEEGD